MNCVGTAPPPSLRVAAHGVLQSGAEAVRPCRCCGRGGAWLHQDRCGLWGRAEGVQQIQGEAVRCQEAWSQEGHDLWTQHRLDLLHHLRCLCSLTHVSGVPCAPRCCAVVNSVFHTASRPPTRPCYRFSAFLIGERITLPGSTLTVRALQCISNMFVKVSWLVRTVEYISA